MAQSTATKTLVHSLIGAVSVAVAAIYALNGDFSRDKLLAVLAAFLVTSVQAVLVYFVPNTVKETPPSQGSVNPPDAAEAPAVEPN